MHREVHHVSGFRKRSCEVQHVGERHADPFGDERPSFLAREVSDLTPGWKTAEVVEREGSRIRDHAVDLELPVRKFAGLEKLERQALWRPAADDRALRDLTARELARHRVARQKTV